MSETHEPCAMCSEALMEDVDGVHGTTVTMGLSTIHSVECPVCHASSGWWRTEEDAWRAWDETMRGHDDE